jgi:hypothetical protein
VARNRFATRVPISVGALPAGHSRNGESDFLSAGSDRAATTAPRLDRSIRLFMLYLFVDLENNSIFPP